jgi:hypothetical protein
MSANTTIIEREPPNVNQFTDFSPGFSKKVQEKGWNVRENKPVKIHGMSFDKAPSMCLPFTLLSFPTLLLQCAVLFLRKTQKSILFPV